MLGDGVYQSVGAEREGAVVDPDFASAEEGDAVAVRFAAPANVGGAGGDVDVAAGVELGAKPDLAALEIGDEAEITGSVAGGLVESGGEDGAIGDFVEFRGVVVVEEDVEAEGAVVEGVVREGGENVGDVVGLDCEEASVLELGLDL
ncbi:hypothetical protein ACFX1S_040393 [Malus domestica]